MSNSKQTEMESSMSSHATSTDSSNSPERDLEDVSVFLDEEGSVVAKDTTTILPNLPKRNSKTFVSFTFGMVLVMVVIALSSACAGGRCAPTRSSAVYDPNDMSHTTYNRDPAQRVAIEQALVQELGVNYFDNSTHSFSGQARQMALHWLLHEDPLQVQATDPNLLQRFILHVLYFQTSKVTSWEECNPARGKETELCFYPKGHLWADEAHSTVWGYRWLSGTNECTWAGILCDLDTKAILELSIGGNNLNGPIPTEMVKLTSMNELSLSNNQLTGSIPSELGSLDSLERINLANNRISGSIPSELFSKSSTDRPLMYLRLMNNTLTGTLPTEIGLFEGAYMFIGDNALTGTLPIELFGLTNLINLFLENVPKISGPLPSELGQLSNLHFLSIANSGLTGTLPTEIGSLSNLDHLSLTNTNLQGTIPEEFYTGLKRLQYAELDHCQFSGTISSSLGQMAELRVFHISHNDFSGTLRAELAKLTTLRSLEINGNKFSGSVPGGVCSLSQEEDWMEFNLVADCMPNAGSGVAAIDCPEDCCTTCCSSESGFCMGT